MTYNLSVVSAGNTTVAMIQNVNSELMGGWLGVMFLVVITAILYMSFVFTTKQPVKSFTGTSFIMIIVSILLFTLELIPVIAVWVYIIATGLSIAFWKLD